MGVSRGPGRVMRGVLDALEAGPLSAPRLALTVWASEGSTRRALRTLHHRRAVMCLGFELGSGQRWALPLDCTWAGGHICGAAQSGTQQS